MPHSLKGRGFNGNVNGNGNYSNGNVNGNGNGGTLFVGKPKACFQPERKGKY